MHFMIDHLVEQIERRNVVPFIGAGLSKAAGLPLWGELIQDMKNELLNWARSEGDIGEEERYLSRADYLDIAARFKHKMGLGHYQRFLQKRYRRPDKGPVEVHRALARISWPFVITTNYDKLLEATFRTSAGFDPRVVIEQEELVTAFGAGEFFILKLHGDIDRPQSIVLTRDEYNAFVNSDRGRLMLDVLRRELMLRTVLFLGFGLSDPNFLRVFGQAGWLAKGYQGEAYAVMADTSRPEREEWAKRSLRIIPIDRYEDLAPFLHQLADNVGAPAMREPVVEEEPGSRIPSRTAVVEVPEPAPPVVVVEEEEKPGFPSWLAVAAGGLMLIAIVAIIYFGFPGVVGLGPFAPTSTPTPTVARLQGIELDLWFEVKTSGAEEFVQGNEEGEYKSGDMLRYHFRPKADGYAYLFNIDTQGKFTPLWPNFTAQNAAQVRAGEDYQTSEFRLDQSEGWEQVFAVVSLEPFSYDGDIAPYLEPLPLPGGKGVDPVRKLLELREDRFFHKKITFAHLK